MKGCEGLKNIINNEDDEMKKININKDYNLLKSVSYYNKVCSSGNKFFVILENGDAWKCWNSVQERNYNGTGFLGNFYKKTFRINEQLEKCRFKKCYYPVPRLIRIYDKKNE